MASDPIVEFAQLRFGTDAGLPADAVTRAPLPDWVAGAADEMRVPAETDSSITVEGRVLTPQELQPAADGTTAEVLAYYLPFHFYRIAWGIYIRGAGVWALARRLALPKKLPDANVLGSAYNLLLDHERLHFFAEYASSRVEVSRPHLVTTPISSVRTPRYMRRHLPTLMRFVVFVAALPESS